MEGRKENPGAEEGTTETIEQEEGVCTLFGHAGHDCSRGKLTVKKTARNAAQPIERSLHSNFSMKDSHAFNIDKT